MTCNRADNTMTDTTSADLDGDLRREHEEATNALHNLIVKRLHAEDCGCKSEVHPRAQWDYYSRLADAVAGLFGANWAYGVRHPGDDSGAWERDDFEDAVDFMRALGWQGNPVRRLTVRHVGEWTEAQR